MGHVKRKIKKSECKNKKGSNLNPEFSFSVGIYFVNASHVGARFALLRLVFCLRLQNKPPAHSFLPYCGTRLCLRRLNRLASRRPRRHPLLAVPAVGSTHRRCPFPQKKITLGSPARPEAPSRRFCCRCQPFAGSSLF